MRKRGWVVIAAMAMVMVACGGGEKEPGVQKTPSPTAVQTTPTVAPGLTKPGSELTLGDTATVEVRTFQDPVGGTAELTVTAIEEKDDVYLIRATARLTEVSNLRLLDPEVDVVGMAGEEIAIRLGPEESKALGCTSDAESSPKVGDEVAICKAVRAPSGGEVDHVLFAPYVGPYSAREGVPLSWR